MEKIASIDRGWLRAAFQPIDMIAHVEKIASIDRGWLLRSNELLTPAGAMVEKIASIDRGWLLDAFKTDH